MDLLVPLLDEKGGKGDLSKEKKGEITSHR